MLHASQHSILDEADEHKVQSHAAESNERTSTTVDLQTTFETVHTDITPRPPICRQIHGEVTSHRGRMGMRVPTPQVVSGHIRTDRGAPVFSQNTILIHAGPRSTVSARSRRRRAWRGIVRPAPML